MRIPLRHGRRFQAEVVVMAVPFLVYDARVHGG